MYSNKVFLIYSKACI